MLAVSLVVILTCLLGGTVAGYHAYKISNVKIAKPEGVSAQSYVHSDDAGDSSAQGEDGLIDSAAMYQKISDISSYIRTGADAFLLAEYTYLAIFLVVFAGLLLLIIGIGHNITVAGFAVISYIIGAATSVLSGFIGMRIAVTANSRTAVQAEFGYAAAFNTAFKAGMVMGFGLVSLGTVILYVLVCLLALKFDKWDVDPQVCQELFEALAGFGLGGSTVALFGRVGGGIYTKAADVGADLSGKVVEGWDEDDPRNPAVIADNVGDNVGDIAGMGADLFGSLAEGSCACMVVAASSPTLFNDWKALMFPLIVLGMGLIVSFITSFIATHYRQVTAADQIEPALKLQLLISTIIMTPVAALASFVFLPNDFVIGTKNTHNWHIYICVLLGLWTGLAIGYITEYFTSYTYRPVQECAEACEAGAAPNIIYGLALGYKSCIIPVFCICVTIYFSFKLSGMFGVACGAIGILSTIATGLTIDAYGPICDNAGGIAEMAQMPSHTRERTDALDAAGNTTAAIGKGFAIGSAALVSFALFGAFVTAAQIPYAGGVSLLQPYTFAGLLFGAMVPYWFSALTMKSVGTAAFDMVNEVKRQLDPESEMGQRIRAGQGLPDYAACISISTKASLREMILPGLLVILTPIAAGLFMGVECLAGVLAGNLVSGVQIAISASNTGGAWDNAKKYIKNKLGSAAKQSPVHKAAVIGDTVGDPLKDTSGPSINILIKLMAIISVVIARALPREGWFRK